MFRISVVTHSLVFVPNPNLLDVRSSRIVFMGASLFGLTPHKQSGCGFRSFSQPKDLVLARCCCSARSAERETLVPGLIALMLSTFSTCMCTGLNDLDVSPDAIRWGCVTSSNWEPPKAPRSPHPPVPSHLHLRHRNTCTPFAIQVLRPFPCSKNF